MKREYEEASEFNANAEYEEVIDNAVVPEAVATEEYQTLYEEENDSSEEKKYEAPKKKAQSTTFLSSSLVGVLASVVVGMTSLLNVNMKAEMTVQDYDFGTGQIAYTVSVENMTEKETLSVTLYENGKLFEETQLFDEDGDGIIEGAFTVDKEEIDRKFSEEDSFKIEYEIKLRGVVGLEVEREFDSYLIKLEKRSAVFRGVDTYCSCDKDGYYHFTMDYSDSSGMYYDFEAYIIDENGKRADCTFTEDYHEEQKIFVADYTVPNCQLYITYMERGKDERQFVKFDNGNPEKDDYLNIKL